MANNLLPYLSTSQPPLTCVETHTTGEPTRILLKGYPHLTPNTTLLQQRAEAQRHHDHIRKRLMLEPRGHRDMYGAILRPDTEHTRSGAAHIGVLFTHNEGYSTMCGHATIALGRVLVDTWDLEVFPRRRELVVDNGARTVVVRLHAPCGLVEVTVPVKEDGKSSDSTRPVSFVSVPSFATGSDVVVEIPNELRWKELEGQESVRVSFAYGGAFTCLVSAEELGFKNGLRLPVDMEAFDRASKRLKKAIQDNPACACYFNHPDHDELEFLYTVMVVDKKIGVTVPGSKGAETGLCFFADQQVDRSPTGSAVAARVAYAYATRDLGMEQSWTYHSLLSNSTDGKGGFVGRVVEEITASNDTDKFLGPMVRVRVEGYAYYTGYHVFLAEKEDPLGESGFLFNRLD